MLKDIADKIKECQKAVILAHDSEDPDALGSCFAVKAALEQMGKTGIVVVSDRIEKRLETFFDGYLIYDENEDYEGDLCICLDCGDRERLGSRTDIFRDIENSVNIDHHYTNNGFADVNYVDEKAAATGEILFELFKELGVELTKEIAGYLYIAIFSDTGGFKYSNVTPKTMMVGAELIGFDIDHAEIARILFDTYSLNAIKLEGAVMGNIHSYADGKVRMVAVEDKMFDKYGVDESEIPDLVNIPRSVEGTEVAVCLKRHSTKIKISLRSNGKVNVAEIAEQFGGGGHIMAAGASITEGSFKDAQRRVSEACIKAVEKYGI